MQCIIFILVCSHLTRTVSSNINYCGAKMCANSDTHTFCQYSEGPGPQCIGFMPAALTKEEKINIIMRMNHRRNDAALGMLGNLPSAGDMLTLRWVEELAHEAQLWANQCSPPEFPEQHDLCRDLYSVPVGQNVASVVGEAPGLRVESMVDLWFMQGRHYKGNVSWYIAPPHNLSYYGDFAQMLWSPTFMVGCARSRFMSLWHGRPRTVERLVCNMAPRGPRAARPMWTAALPATACPPRSRPATQYAGLCAMYDIQKFDDKKNNISLEQIILLSSLLELETNSSLDHFGGLDEIYLTKLAAVTMEQLNTRSQRNRSRSLKEIVENLGVNLEDYNDVLNNRILRERRKIRKYLRKVSKPRRKLRFVGRPKPYYLYELSKEDEKIMQNTDFIPKNSTIEKVRMNIQTVTDDDNKGIGFPIELYNREEISFLDRRTKNSENSNGTSSEVKAIDKNLTEFSSTLSNSVSNNDDDTEISDKVIQDYFSNPETAREIQETLLRMEQSMGNQSTDSFPSPIPVYSTPAKVRRELRSTESEEFKKFKMELERTKTSPKRRAVDEDDTLEDYKNKVVLDSKGSLFQSLVSYLPNVKTFGIGAGSEHNTACAFTSSLSVYISPLLLFYE